MEDAQKIIDELVTEDFPVIVMKILNKVYEELSTRKSGKTSVTIDSLAKYRRLFDFVSESSIAIFKNNIVQRSQLKLMEKQHADTLRIVQQVQDRPGEHVAVEARDVRTVRETGHVKPVEVDTISIICTKTNEDMELEDLRSSIRSACIDAHLPLPFD